MDLIDDHPQPPVEVIGIGPGNGRNRTEIEPSQTASVIQDGDMAMFFAFVANKVVENSYVRPQYEQELEFESEHGKKLNNKPVKPNHVEVAPFLSGKIMKYSVQTSVDLPGGGRMQEAWASLQVNPLPGVFKDAVLIDSHTGLSVINPLGRDRLGFVILEGIFKIERASITGKTP